VFVADTDLARQEAVTSMPGVAGLDPGHHESASVVVLAVPRGHHVDAAHRWLVAGAHVVSIADDPTEIRSLLELHDLAVSRRRSLVVGAGFAPGLTGLLARHGADFLDEVSRVAVATTGTGGPACARQHHRAFKRPGAEWWDRRWRSRRGGSARELMWFPDPIGARDCYRGDLADPLLIHRGLPSAERIIARMSATRRDRLMARLPMLRPPHADGGPGAIRVEVRGRRAGAVETLVYGAHDHPSVGAAAVATELALAADSGEVPVGAIGTAEIPRPVWMLARLRSAGVCIETYESFR
jgi:hypothetical protein